MVVLSRAFLHEHFLFFTYITTLREHPAHQAHLQAASVDKLRRQESLWREDLQSGGNLRTTTPTFSDWRRNKRPPPFQVVIPIFSCHSLHSCHICLSHCTISNVSFKKNASFLPLGLGASDELAISMFSHFALNVFTTVQQDLPPAILHALLDLYPFFMGSHHSLSTEVHVPVSRHSDMQSRPLFLTARTRGWALG